MEPNSSNNRNSKLDQTILQLGLQANCLLLGLQLEAPSVSLTLHLLSIGVLIFWVLRLQENFNSAKEVRPDSFLLQTDYKQDFLVGTSTVLRHWSCSGLSR